MLHSLYDFEKDWEQGTENSEGLFNSLVLEKIAELAMHLESLQIEVEILEKQNQKQKANEKRTIEFRLGVWD